MNECIICLEDISSNNYNDDINNINNNIINNNIIKLECCNNEVHYLCICKWINDNIHTNYELDKCFLCKNENSLIYDMYHNIKLIHQHNAHIISVNINDFNNELNDNNSDNNSINIINNGINTSVINRINRRMCHRNMYNLYFIICIFCGAIGIFFLFNRH